MLKTLLILLICLAACLLIVIGFRLLFPVPDRTGRGNSVHLKPNPTTRLGGLILPQAAAHPGRSGVAQLQDGIHAFAARLQLVEMADQGIDLQYYIWQRDITGVLLLDALHRAAERGVRVRMLLDDNGVGGIAPELAELDSHPNIEIRLFNPFVLRWPRLLTYALDFRRVNRRMHNKSFTVDGAITLVGGRNIGDNYFSQDSSVNFFDMDVAALGSAAQEVSKQFDDYWASPSSVPVDLILAPPQTGALAAALSEIRIRPTAGPFEKACRDLPMIDTLTGEADGFDWVPVTLVADDPAKGQGPVPRDLLLTRRLLALLPAVERDLHLISAYLVPGRQFTETLIRWAGSGRQVRTLTNAQESTDVLPVHAGYVRYRAALVKGGVEVYELKAEQDRRDPSDQFGLIGSANSSLHTKTFVIDRKTLFVGSFNFDPRSARLNTEMGFLIEHPGLAQSIARGFDRQLTDRAYRVEQASGGGLQWREIVNGDSDAARVHHTEPGTGAPGRWLVRLLALLPIEWLL